MLVGPNHDAHILQNEIWTAPADRHNTSGQYNPAVHSTSGINSVSLNGYPSDLDSRIIQTTQEMDEFPYNIDMNSESSSESVCRIDFVFKKQPSSP